MTVPVQGFPMTTTAPTDYAGNFNAPGVQTGILEAAYLPNAEKVVEAALATLRD